MKKDELLSFEEITHLTKIFVQLGVTKLRLTGGEPLLRKDLAGLVAQLAGLEGLDDIDLTTNGALLGKDWITVPAPESVTSDTLLGDGWTLDLAEGWRVQPGDREGDFVVVRSQ